MDRFSNALGRSESGGRYDVVNDLGYTGKYQWGPERLADFNKALGTNYTLEDFKNNPTLQETAQAWHEKDIENYMFDNGLDYFLGKTVAGVPITQESVLAMAHLGGKNGMRRFLESGGEYNPQDDYGTSLRDYAMRFATDKAYRDSERAMGQTPLSYSPEDVGTTPAADRIGKLMTAYEMMSTGSQFCPDGMKYDAVTGACVPVDRQTMPPPRRPAPEKGAALQNLGIQSLIA